eukprot:3282117-Amphidinium_carterae.1
MEVTRTPHHVLPPVRLSTISPTLSFHDDAQRGGYVGSRETSPTTQLALEIGHLCCKLLGWMLILSRLDAVACDLTLRGGSPNKPKPQQ